MPEIIEVIPQGYCGGVMQAIAKVKKLRQRRPQERITVLGNLVHNTFVKKALQSLQIDTIEQAGATRLELLDAIDSGIVVFTAHGVSQAVRDKAAAKGLEVVDASCPFVLSTQKQVAKALEEGYAVFYIGKYAHPEAESIYSSSLDVHLIEKEADIPSGIEKPIFVTNQTTMSIFDIQDLFAAISRIYPEAKFLDELCNATRVRQQAILDLQDENIDVLIVVGDPASNNTRKLEAIGQQAGIPTILRIESAKDLEGIHFDDTARIAITSGASTPGYLKDGVKRYLENPKEKQEIDLEHILD